MNSKTEEKNEADSNKEYIGWKKKLGMIMLKKITEKNLDWKV